VTAMVFIFITYNMGNNDGHFVFILCWNAVFTSLAIRLFITNGIGAMTGTRFTGPRAQNMALVPGGLIGAPRPGIKKNGRAKETPCRSIA